MNKELAVRDDEWGRLDSIDVDISEELERRVLKIFDKPKLDKFNHYLDALIDRDKQSQAE